MSPQGDRAHTRESHLSLPLKQHLDRRGTELADDLAFDDAVPRLRSRDRGTRSRATRRATGTAKIGGRVYVSKNDG